MIPNFSPDENSSLKSDKMVLICMGIHEPNYTQSEEKH